MTESLIVFSGNDAQYLAIVWHLAREARRQGENPVLLDLTPVVAGIGDAYNRRVLKALGRSSAPTDLTALLTQDGHEVLSAQARGGQRSLPQLAEDGISESVRSALISYARDPHPRTSRAIWRNLERHLEDTARDSFTSVAAVLEERTSIDTVYVANGRFPHQRAAIDAALVAGRSVRYYEKGELPDTYWLEDHSTLNRTETQSRVDAVLAHLSPVDASATGLEWMDARSARGSASNIYSRFFDEEPASEARPSSQRVIGLFTSSQDEFASLGPEWHVQEWVDQWSAFDHALTHLEPFGYVFFLRVHPNFITKSHASFVRERAQLEKLQRDHPTLRVIWHDQQASSYALMESSDAVIVWDSTVGLEASGRGIPVWELAASYYDLYADVRTWFAPADDPSADEFFYTVDTDRAHRFMAYLVLRDRPLPPEAITIRDMLAPKPGLPLTIAGIAGAGGAPTARVALSSIIDSMRHRRFAINRIAFGRFLARGRARV